MQNFRLKFISFLKRNSLILKFFWICARLVLQLAALFMPCRKKQILFASFGGRKFDDSPRSLYEEILQRPEFDDWNIIWAFVDPNKFDIPRGKKIKMDSFAFFRALIQSHVWVSNSVMDRLIGLKLKHVVRVETWHGTPLKKICGDEHSNALGGKQKAKKTLDSTTIRCAQSDFDRNLFQRLFNASRECFLMCDLPRNDRLLHYSKEEILSIKKKLNIPLNKKVILYAPTYREYLWDEKGANLIAPPMNLKKWRDKLSNDYILLFRAHYAVGTALNIKTDDFLKDVSDYPTLNDLYAISDLMISDYSSCYFDYSILDRPMLNFSYDLEEYEEKRGLYLNLDDVLPCKIRKNEDEVLNDITSLDYTLAISQSKLFHEKFAPFAGNASKAVVDEILRRV